MYNPGFFIRISTVPRGGYNAGYPPSVIRSCIERPKGGILINVYEVQRCISFLLHGHCRIEMKYPANLPGAGSGVSARGAMTEQKKTRREHADAAFV